MIFLPGILMPAALRYERLLAALGTDVDPVVKELEVYRGPSTPPPGYSLEAELAGIARAADEARLERFHLYGHSGGGACALAFTASQPERVLTIAVDKPAIGFSAEDLQEMEDVFLPMLELPPEQQMAAFVQEQMRAGVDPPPRPDGPSAAVDVEPSRRGRRDAPSVRGFGGPDRAAARVRPTCVLQLRHPQQRQLGAARRAALDVAPEPHGRALRGAELHGHLAHGRTRSCGARAPAAVGVDPQG